MKLTPGDAKRFKDLYLAELDRAIREVPYLDIPYFTTRIAR